MFGKRILVTGGFGFIGSRLVIRLLQENAAVAVLGRKLYQPWRLGEALGRLEVYQADIREEAQVRRAIRQFRPEVIYHLAAYGVNAGHNDYLDAVNTNVVGLLHLLNAAKEAGCTTVVQVGSSAEYGDQTDEMHETTPLAPVSIYGSTKASAALIGHQVASELGLRLTTLRPFGVFGEGEEPHKLFCDIMLRLLRDEEVNLTGCEQYRDYCYVGNLVDGLLLAASHPAAAGQIFNIGSGTTYPLKHFVELIFACWGTDKTPNYGALPYRPNERWHPRPSIAKIQTLLGWEPKVSLEEGIRRTVLWYKQHRKHYAG